jgi:heme exporter protein B
VKAPSTIGVVLALARAQLRIELRSFESLPAMCMFSVTALVLFHFGLDRDQLSGDLASGVLWVTLLLAALLAINRIYVADADQGGFDAFVISRAPREALLYAKLLVLILYMALVELVVVPAFAILLLETSIWQALPGLLGPLALGDIGIAVIGALVGALAVRTPVRDLLGPLMALPLLVPVLLCVARWSSPLFDYPRATGVAWRWPLVLGLYDALFGLIAFALFEFLLED